MAYEWALEESIPEGIKRLIDEEINVALEQLKDDENNRDDAVHEARKSLKKIRAIYRLIRDEIGEESYQEANVFYRDLGRRLAPLRDSFVVAETLSKLTDEIDDDDLRKVAKHIHEDLQDRYIETKQVFLQSDEIETVIEALEEASNSLDIGIKDDDFSVFKKGLRRVYKRGQNRMETAFANIPSAEGFHDWRKRVKYLWYHMLIFKPVHPAQIIPLIAQLDELSDLLGEAHDLAVLYQHIEQHPRTQDGAGRHLLAHIDQKRGELEASARPFGNAIYEMNHKEFSKQVQKWWENPKPILA